jgi:hypothetical protein
MTGKRYYVTTLGTWKRNCANFANSHWLLLNDEPLATTGDGVSEGLRDAAGKPATSDVAPILALIEADEGAHSSLEDDREFEALPHPFSPTPISEKAHATLSACGLKPAATTVDVAEFAAKRHPLLAYRVF